MKKDELPTGWDCDRVRRVLTHYEQQTVDEVVAEDEEAMRPSEAVMSVPDDLVPKIRELIAKRRG